MEYSGDLGARGPGVIGDKRRRLGYYLAGTRRKRLSSWQLAECLCVVCQDQLGQVQKSGQRGQTGAGPRVADGEGWFGCKIGARAKRARK